MLCIRSPFSNLHPESMLRAFQSGFLSNQGPILLIWGQPALPASFSKTLFLSLALFVGSKQGCVLDHSSPSREHASQSGFLIIGSPSSSPYSQAFIRHNFTIVIKIIIRHYLTFCGFKSRDSRAVYYITLPPPREHASQSGFLIRVTINDGSSSSQ